MIEIIITALCVSNLLLNSATLVWAVRKEKLCAPAVNSVLEAISSEGSQVRSHASLGLRQSLNATSSMQKEVKTQVQELSAHLSTHTQDLAQQTEQLKSHARAVIDNAAQQRPRQTRQLCPKCQRVVYKYTSRADGTIFLCDDCRARS